MKWHELNNKSEVELRKLLAEKRKDLVDLSFKAGTGALKQVHQIRETRRLVSKILTKLSQEPVADEKKATEEKEEKK